MNQQYNYLNPSWSDYLGDTLRGNVPVNQLIPQHPYILDTLGLAEAFAKNTQHIMLLTLDEAQGVIDDLLNGSPMHYASTYAGNIKDTATGLHNFARLASYAEAGKVVYRLKGLGIKAIPYQHGGQYYIKITGHASLRRILNGTRYKINNPRILELGIGKAGVNVGIIEGAKFCIWFSLAFHTVELIFKSDHDVAAFIGNITMDVAKIIVTMFVTEIAPIVGGLASVILSALGFATPIAVGIFLIVAIGIGITATLDYLDNDKYHLSERLISAIREWMNTQQNIEQWNVSHSNPFTPGLMNAYR